jgi:hypothetical protein
MFVLNPDPYLLPAYRISPFQTKDIQTNNRLAQSNAIDKYFDERFSGRQYRYVADGRAAINMALQQYHLQPGDIVTIFTTSGNFYISSCVTKEIEKFCKWSRNMETGTRLIFVNHEFGFPFAGMEELKKYKLPIIEDCAHSFFSEDVDHSIGNTGDFVIYSFPKMFPVQIGGLLTVKNGISILQGETVPGDQLQYIKNVLSYYIKEKEDIISRRLENYRYLLNKIAGNQFEERFQSAKGIVPGIFMFRVIDENINLLKLKEYLYAHGIQCSVFYGERSFFIPVHQKLVKEDMDYFSAVIHSFPKSV